MKKREIEISAKNKRKGRQIKDSKRRNKITERESREIKKRSIDEAKRKTKIQKLDLMSQRQILQNL